MTYKTEQEAFWAGEFGTQYIERNTSEQMLASNLALFATALRQAYGIESMIEFGANVGMNLRALKWLLPSAEQFGIEINEDAAKVLSKIIPAGHVFHQSLLDFESTRTFDLVFVKGVLIHINPDCLPDVYDRLVRASGKYLLVAEYYNPSPVAVRYQGHKDRLFKRDFCGELLDRHPSLALIDYGFVYHRDVNFPQDDINWFLMQKLD